MQRVMYRNLTDEDKRQICGWRYDGAYAMYNLPSYEDMKAQKIGFMDPKSQQNYFAFIDGDKLVGFVNILEEPTEVFLGVGANPALCNQHYGREMLALACDISKHRYPDKPLYLEVRTWNTRAVRCYQRAGFHIDGQPYELTTGIGEGIFYRMIKE